MHLRICALVFLINSIGDDMNNQSDLTHQDIRSAYQQLSTELPSEAINSELLQQARQTAEQREGSNLNGKVTSIRHKYQWPLSLAASVAFIAIMYLDSTEVYLPQKELQGVPTPIVEAIPSPTEMEGKTRQFSDMHADSVSSPVKSRSTQQESNTKKIATLNSQNTVNEQTDVMPMEFNRNHVQDAEIAASQLAEKQQSRQAEIEAISVTGSRVVAIPEVPTNGLNTKIDEVVANLTNTDKNSPQLAILQQQLFELMEKLKLQHPSTSFKSEHLDLLSDKQRKMLQDLHD